MISPSALVAWWFRCLAGKPGSLFALTKRSSSDFANRLSSAAWAASPPLTPPLTPRGKHWLGGGSGRGGRRLDRPRAGWGRWHQVACWAISGMFKSMLSSIGTVKPRRSRKIIQFSNEAYSASWYPSSEALFPHTPLQRRNRAVETLIANGLQRPIMARRNHERPRPLLATFTP